MTARAWTPAEDQLLRDRYVTDGAQSCADALGRTWTAITRRAARLKVVRVRRWTFRENNQLRLLWGIHPIAKVASMMGRTEAAVYWRAQQLGLGVGCPQGFEYLSNAAARTGYAVTSLRKLLNWARVPIARAVCRPDRASKSRNGHVTWIVVPADVDEAIERWHETETLERAADRYAVCSSVLARLLDEAAARGDERVPKRPAFKRHWRVPSALVDEIMAARAKRESVASAAARVRVTGPTLAGWLRAAGVTFTRRDGVAIEDVDRVIAAKKATTGCKAWLVRKARARADRRAA